ncbi:hypothetical protein GCM10010987_00690 [Bradyrhizobium guangdongense]|uniref:Uncharacterized protein n=3 Tax=Bradyrhizobium guangdongense TaxID=1325090 RepID=A0AA87VZA6_9BRAD|nr:hypothetical protein GCM10010987_00690 [Bradyrhizobium guangdongense]
MTRQRAYPTGGAFAPKASNIGQNKACLQGHKADAKGADVANAHGMHALKPIVSTSLALVAVFTTTMICNADTVRKRDRSQPSTEAVYDYGPYGPNRAYQSGPHTRIYVSKRSWLDGGTEVLPGDRKFSDYAYPPGTSFARQNNNRPLDRQPLSPASDLGGFEQRIPLAW